MVHKHSGQVHTLILYEGPEGDFLKFSKNRLSKFFVNQIFSNFQIQNFQILIQNITFTLENGHLEVI